MYFLLDTQTANFSEKKVKVKSYLREGKVVQSYVAKRDVNNQSELIKKAGVVVGLVTGAALLGMSGKNYFKFRKAYREGFKTSAKIAEEKSFEIEGILRRVASGRDEAKAIEVELKKKVKAGDKDAEVLFNLVKNYKPDQKRFALVVGGFDGEGIESKAIITGFPGKKNLQIGKNKFIDYEGEKSQIKNLLSEHNVIPLINNKLQIPNVDPNKLSLSVIFNQYRKHIKNLVGNATKNRMHDDAVQMSAITLALKRIHPDKPVDLVGYCGGGMGVAESIEQLKTLGVNAKGLNIASPYFGLTNLNPTELVTVITENDIYFNLPSQNRIVIKDTNGHSYFKDPRTGTSGYQNSKELASLMKKHFGY